MDAVDGNRNFSDTIADFFVAGRKDSTAIET
jgi:hypothetical protein